MEVSCEVGQGLEEALPSHVDGWMDGRMMTFCIVVDRYQCSKGICYRELQEEDSKSLPRQPSSLRILFHSCNLL